MSAAFDPDDFAKTLKVAWASAKEKMKEDTINNIIVAFPVFYKCGGVLQWLNLLDSPVPGVSLSEDAVSKAREDMAVIGGNVPLTNETVMVLVATHDYAPMQHKGAMICLSPLERAHGMLHACVDSLGNDDSDAIARAWAKRFRNVTFEFVAVPDPKYVALYNFALREDAIQKGEQAGWTTMQKIQMVIRERQQGQHNRIFSLHLLGLC